MSDLCVVDHDALWLQSVGADRLPSYPEHQIYCGDDRNIAKVWVRGKEVAGQDHRPRAD